MTKINKKEAWDCPFFHKESTIGAKLVVAEKVASDTSDQSYKASTIIIYESIVVNIINFLEITTLES